MFSLKELSWHTGKQSLSLLCCCDCVSTKRLTVSLQLNLRTHRHILYPPPQPLSSLTASAPLTGSPWNVLPSGLWHSAPVALHLKLGNLESEDIHNDDSDQNSDAYKEGLKMLLESRGRKMIENIESSLSQFIAMTLLYFKIVSLMGM